MAIVNKISNFFKSFFAPGEGQVRDSTVNQGISHESFDFEFEDKLRRSYEKTTGLALTKTICRQLELAVSNDTVLSSGYARLLALADTEFEIELDAGGKRKSKELLKFMDTFIPRLFGPDYDSRKVMRHILAKLFTYGVYNCQVLPDPSFSTISRIIEPQPYTMTHYRQDDRWILVQQIWGQTIAVNRETFIRRAIWEIQNDEGIWVIPPFKAALGPSHALNLFIESLRQIAIRTGMQKLYDITLKASEDYKLGRLNPGTEEGRRAVKRMNDELNNYIAQIRKNMPNGVIIHPDNIEIQELSTVEPSANLITFHTLLANQVSIGAKVYPFILGLESRENQTTITDNQRIITRSLLTTIQSEAIGAYKRIAELFALLNGYSLEMIKINMKPPELFTQKEVEEGEKAKLENERAKKEMENDEEGRMDSQGDIDKKEKNKEDEKAKNKGKQQKEDSEED